MFCVSNWKWSRATFVKLREPTIDEADIYRNVPIKFMKNSWIRIRTEKIFLCCLLYTCAHSQWPWPTSRFVERIHINEGAIIAAIRLAMTTTAGNRSAAQLLPAQSWDHTHTLQGPCYFTYAYAKRCDLMLGERQCMARICVDISVVIVLIRTRRTGAGVSVDMCAVRFDARDGFQSGHHSMVAINLRGQQNGVRSAMWAQPYLQMHCT